MLRQDEILGAHKEDGPFHGVLEFPDITGPAVTLEHIHGSQGNTHVPLPRLPGEMPDKVAGQGQDVILAVPQRRKDDGKDIKPVKEITPERTLGHHLLEIAVGGRNHAYIHAYGLHTPETLEGALLKNAEELGLGHHGKLAYLIEEQRAPVCLLKTALAHACGAGEGPLLMSEKLAFNEAFGKSRAVERHKGTFGPGARGMNGAGGQFLARAGFALQENRGRRLGYLHNLGVDMLHDVRIAHEALGTLRGHVLLIHLALRLPGCVAEQRSDDGHKLLLFLQLDLVSEQPVHGKSAHHLLIQPDGYADIGNIGVGKIPGARSVEEKRLLGNIGNIHRLAGLHDSADDALALHIAAAGTFRGLKAVGRFDAYLSGLRRNQRNCALHHVQPLGKQHEYLIQRVLHICRRGQDLRKVVEQGQIILRLPAFSSIDSKLHTAASFAEDSGSSRKRILPVTGRTAPALFCLSAIRMISVHVPPGKRHGRPVRDARVTSTQIRKPHRLQNGAAYFSKV